MFDSRRGHHKQKFSSYSPDLNNEILEKYFSNQGNAGSLAREYAISKKTINYWISKSKKGIDISVDYRPCNTDRKSKTDNENYKDYDLQKVDLSKNIANVKSDSFLNFI